MLKQRYNIATSYSTGSERAYPGGISTAQELQIINRIGLQDQTVKFFDNYKNACDDDEAVVLNFTDIFLTLNQHKTLKLVLTHEWYDQTADGLKVTEYREITDNWTKRIWEPREALTHVTFYRAYAKDRASLTRRILTIDKGPCPIEGWDDEYYRITFEGLTTKQELAPCPK